jgi:tetratricopeptide (TPR) repeat protein
MHECLDVPGWIKAWGDPEVEGRQLATCQRCAPYRRDLEAWLAAVQKCPECQDALEAVPIDREEVVNCPRCMDAFAKLHELLDELEHFDPGVASEVLTAEELFGKLAKREVPEQLARVTEDIRYQQWGLVQRLLAATREAWCDDPELANDRATVAVAVADLLDPTTYHPQWVADLQAKAHAYLANTHRILADFPAAEREFLRAEHHLRRGVRSGRCRAQVFTLKASLLIDQQRFVEAGALLREVEAYYKRAEEHRELARTQLKGAIVASGQGDYRGAADECARASSNLNPRRDRRLSVLARQNAAYFLILAGDTERARGLFDSLPPAPDRQLELRRKWAEGNLLRAEGRLTLAMDALREARKGYREDGRFYLVALVALDEALTAFDMGDTEDMAAMVDEASILLVKAAAKQEALAVLRVLMAAIERGTVDRAMLVAVCQRVAAFKPS